MKQCIITFYNFRIISFAAGAFIVGISGVAALAAGVIAAKTAKKKSHEYYKDLNMEPKIVLESPTSLAFRALAWSTVISVGCFSLAVFSVCKWYGISNVSIKCKEFLQIRFKILIHKLIHKLLMLQLDDLRAKFKELKKAPKVPSSPNERTEFENLSDFLNYLNETYKSK